MTGLDAFIKKIDEKQKNMPWYEKAGDFFVYTIWRNGIVELYYNLKWYFRNKRTFRKMMWKWRPWDSRYQIDLFAFGLEQLRDEIYYHGSEERTSANKKIAAIDELIFQLNRDVESEVNYDSEHIKEYQKEVAERRNKQYEIIFKLIKGQNQEDYTGDGKYENYVQWFDGSGIEGWWD